MLCLLLLRVTLLSDSRTNDTVACLCYSIETAHAAVP